MATRWRVLAWEAGKGGLANSRLAEKGYEARMVTPQTAPQFREFLDKKLEWPVLDDRSKLPGLPWRSRRGRVRPSEDVHKGKQNWDTRSLFRDIDPPEFVPGMLTTDHQVALYRGEHLVGAVTYTTDFLSGVAVAPSDRNRKVASWLVLGAMEHMKSEGASTCEGFIPKQDTVKSPWIVHWLKDFGFETISSDRMGTFVRAPLVDLPLLEQELAATDPDGLEQREEGTAHVTE
eukprot:Sspe_Gene.100903::Locus_75543_Transcript_2_2_Confidence_0.400_Length_795::g.100903::m.100903